MTNTKLLRWMVSLVLAPAASAADFVLIKGGILRPGRPPVRVDDFEMQARPVTNAEYAVFVAEAKYTPPQHFEGGKPPAGMENWPVIFVNRHDAAAYIAWLSRKDKRVYRLPTAAEFG
ncbi:MAG: formylglycine-generating enzyme family protein, partial [Acidobacteria bacterium]|nr:formylglycine-generating enzyme family protein [Acidobacteriota bacterium]